MFGMLLPLAARMAAQLYTKYLLLSSNAADATDLGVLDKVLTILLGSICKQLQGLLFT